MSLPGGAVFRHSDFWFSATSEDAVLPSPYSATGLPLLSHPLAAQRPCARDQMESTTGKTDSLISVLQTRTENFKLKVQDDLLFFFPSVFWTTPGCCACMGEVGEGVGGYHELLGIDLRPHAVQST